MSPVRLEWQNRARRFDVEFIREGIDLIKSKIKLGVWPEFGPPVGYPQVPVHPLRGVPIERISDQR